MRCSKVLMFAFVLLVSLGVFSCGTEKDKVVKYLTKIKDYVNSQEYKAVGLSFLDASITTSPAGEVSFDENKLNESISALIEKKDLEICKEVGFKDREEAKTLVNKYTAEAEVKTLIEGIDKSMNDLAVEFQKEGMAKVYGNAPPPVQGKENLQTPTNQREKKK
jgi:hypothetical protein